MEYRQYSVSELRNLLGDAKAGVNRMFDDVDRLASSQLQAAGERPVQFFLQADAIHAARDAYVQSVQSAAASFLSVCDELICLQGSCDREVNRVFTQAGAAAGPGLVLEMKSFDELSANIQTVVKAYSDKIEEVQMRFVAGWKEFAYECDDQLDLFKGVVARECDISVETLDVAVHTAKQTGETTKYAALAGPRWPAVVLLAATAVGVAAATVTVYAAGVAVTAIWDYFGVPKQRN